MLNKLKVIILLGLCSPCLQGESINDISITKKTDNVNRRYYFVARLERTMKLLNTIKQQKSKLMVMNRQIDFNHLVDFNDCQAFKHNRIQSCIAAMKRDQTLKPLYSVWDEFSAYKFLEDELFIDEFTKEIFVISRNLLLQVMPQNLSRSLKPSIKDLFNQAMKGPASSIMDYIDLFTDALCNIVKSEPVSLKIQSNYRISDLHHEIHTNEVSGRFYQIKRVMKSLATLELFSNDKTVFKYNPSKDNPFVIFDDAVQLSHPRIVRCIESMEIEHSLKPLFVIWDDYKQFKYVADDQFNRDFFVTIFLTYKNILTNNNLDNTQKRGSLSNAAQVIEKINSLPVDEILEAIDTFVEVVEIAGLRKPISWKQWSSEYWWVAPTVIGSILYSYFSH